MSKKIKDLEELDRPREKLFKYGVEKLTNTELFAILIRTGKAGKSSLDLAKEVVKIWDTDPESINLVELTKIKGIGKAKASEILAVMEIGKRYLLGKQSQLVLTPSDIWKYWDELKNAKKEHFIIFYLDAKNQVVKKNIVSIGTLTESLVHPREVFEKAILSNAHSIILSHNHPSGSLEPSEEDLAVTKRLVKAGEILGIYILDHVIVSNSGFYSFRENREIFFE